MRVSGPIPVVFDTDIGGDVDDALALALALASPEIEVVAVSVGHGDSGLIQRRARTAARILGLAGRGDVPVLRGVAGWMSGEDAYRWRGEPVGLLAGGLPGDAQIVDVPAVEWICRAARAQELEIVATGPFTTVATALREDSTLAGRLRGLTVMGGMVHPEHLPRWWCEHPEEATPAIDYNTQCDPAAALTCAQSGVAMTWVTIEVTLHTKLTTAGLERLRTAGTPLCDALAQLAKTWSDKGFRHREHGQPDAVANLHDPLAMASLIGGDWLTMRSERLRYAIEDGLFVARPDDNGTAARVSTGVDAAAFERFFLDRVARGS